MRVTTIFSVVALTALANGATILDAVKTIQSDAKQLQETVLKWKGDLDGFGIILAQASSVIGATKNGSKTASESASLDDAAAATVASATSDLARQVNSMTKAIIDVKMYCVHLEARTHNNATDLVIDKAEEGWKATDDLSSNVTAKVQSEVIRRAIKNNMDDMYHNYSMVSYCYHGTTSCNGLGS